jgi:drug/metabolite transporter (DMT)-like permease
MVERVRTSRLLALAATLLGILLMVIGVIYLVKTEHQIPSFFPGHVSHPASHHHVKHGIAAILLGLACLAFAWFQTGPRGRSASPQP